MFMLEWLPMIFENVSNSFFEEAGRKLLKCGLEQINKQSLTENSGRMNEFVEQSLLKYQIYMKQADTYLSPCQTLIKLDNQRTQAFNPECMVYLSGSYIVRYDPRILFCPIYSKKIQRNFRSLVKIKISGRLSQNQIHVQLILKDLFIPFLISLHHNPLLMKYLVLLVLLAMAMARDNPGYDTLYRPPSNSRIIKSQEMHWFEQIIDHYDYRQEQHFQQRYWVVEEYFNPKIGPVFIYICGEWVCDGVPNQRQWLGVLAEKLKGIILVLEHRFYGDSLPFGKQSFTIDNMRVLNSEQALKDLAYFIGTIKSKGLYGITDNPWVSVGGSYAGSLSAWFRIKYPHLVIGSLASSAVVLAIEDFKDFDEQIYTSTLRSGDYCSNAFNASNHRLQALLYSSDDAALAFKSQFPGGDKLSNEQFLFFWADTNVMTVQYGGRTVICSQLFNKTSDEQFQILKQNAKLYKVYEYSAFWLQNQTMTYETKSNARPWWFQYCTEYGWFQTYSDRHPMRSYRLDLQYYRSFCQKVFGVEALPKILRTNSEYGGLNERVTNIIYSNGVEDPWRWASLQRTSNKDLLARVIDCPNCGHCVDLYSPEMSDADSLKKARDDQYLQISEWINDYWSENRLRKLEKVLLKEV